MIRRAVAVLLGCCAILICLPSIEVFGSDPDKSPISLADHYRQALRIDPDNLTLHYFLGITLLTEDRVEDALAEFRLAYPAFTDSIEMNYNLGLAYSLSGDPDSALIYFDRAGELGAASHPELFPLGDAYYNLGVSYLERDALEEAGRMFEKSLALDPRNSEIHRLLGDLHARRGKIDRALQEFGLFLERHPDDRAAREYVYTLHFNQGQAHLETEDFEAARQDFRMALDASPGSPLALYYLGYLDYRQGRLQEAVERLKPAVQGAEDEIRRNIAAILYNCSLTMLENGNARQALEAIAPLLEGPYAAARENYLAGNIHLALQEHYQAHLLYQKVLELEPGHRGAALNLVATAAGAVDELVDRGKALYKKDRFRESLERFEQALAINSADPRARAYRDQILLDLRQLATTLFDDSEKAMQAGDWSTALDRAREGRSLAPSDPRGTELEEMVLGAMQREITEAVEEGNALLADDLLSEAERTFERVLELDPDHGPAQRGRERAAELRLEGALEATSRGNLALEEGRLAEARSAFEEALRLKPELDASREGLTKTTALLSAMVAEELQWGRRAKSGGDLLQARTHFAKALQLREDAETRAELAALDRALEEKIGALLAAAEAALEGNNFSHARRYLEQVLDLAPRNPAALAKVAAVDKRSASAIDEGLAAADKHLVQKQFHEALGKYREVLDIDPTNRRALSGLEKGRSRLKGELDQLVTVGAEALELGRFEAADEAFRKALLLDPYQQDARRGLDRIEQLKLTGDKPGDEQRLYLRGIELYTRGRYEEAVATWKRVLFLAPDHEKALMNIEKAQRKLRQIREYHNG